MTAVMYLVSMVVFPGDVDDIGIIDYLNSIVPVDDNDDNDGNIDDDQ